MQLSLKAKRWDQSSLSSFSRSKSTPVSIRTYPQRWNQETVKTNLLPEIRWVPILGGFDFLYELRKIDTRAVKSSKQQGEGFRVLGLTYNLAEEPFKSMGKLNVAASSILTFDPFYKAF